MWWRHYAPDTAPHPPPFASVENVTLSFSMWQKTQFGYRVTVCDAWRDVWEGMVLLWWRAIGVGGHAGDRAQLDPDTIWD